MKMYRAGEKRITRIGNVFFVSVCGTNKKKIINIQFGGNLKILALIINGKLTVPVQTLSPSTIPQLGKVLSMKLVRRKRMSKMARDERRSTKYFLSWMSWWWRMQMEVTLPIRPNKDMTGIITAYITHLKVSAILHLKMNANSPKTALLSAFLQSNATSCSLMLNVKLASLLYRRP